MTQLQTDSIWEGFQNHQETVERRNQKEDTFICDKLFSFLSWSCLYLLGKHGNSVGTATPGSSVFRMAFLLVWPILYGFHEFCDKYAFPQHALHPRDISLSALFHCADTCLWILCFWLSNKFESHVNNKRQLQGKWRGQWWSQRPLFPFSVFPPWWWPLIIFFLDSVPLESFMLSFLCQRQLENKWSSHSQESMTNITNKCYFLSGPFVFHYGSLKPNVYIKWQKFFRKGRIKHLKGSWQQDHCYRRAHKNQGTQTQMPAGARGSMKRISRSVKAWKIQRACAHLKWSSSRGSKGTNFQV